MREGDEIERAVTAFARAPGWRSDRERQPRARQGDRDLISSSRHRHRLPAVVLRSTFRRRRRPDLLRSRFRRQLSARCHYFDRILKRRETGRSASTGADQERALINLKAAKAAWPHRTVDRYSPLADEVINRSTRCPLLAQSGHAELHCTCPLSGAKRT